MSSFFQKQLISFFLFNFIFIFFNNPTLSALKTTVTEVNNDVFVLDVYGKRFNLKKSDEIKSGDFLKTNNLPASFILKNKTKICLSANSSLKITTSDLIKENYEITFQFRSGDLYLSIPNNSIDKHNIKFFNYSIKNSKNDLVLSKNSELELINYRNSFNLFFKDKKNKKVPPLTYLKLSKVGDIVHSSKIMNSDDIKKKFLVGCINKISKDKLKNNSRELQYGCITQSGKLVCGNRYK
ncbi:hypothetical protein N9S02_01465 [Alphaproteobacteria bacterium]|nr:hypothetical protein [Alphaproteobacteria bacterium]